MHRIGCSAIPNRQARPPGFANPIPGTLQGVISLGTTVRASEDTNQTTLGGWRHGCIVVAERRARCCSARPEGILCVVRRPPPSQDQANHPRRELADPRRVRVGPKVRPGPGLGLATVRGRTAIGARGRGVTAGRGGSPDRCPTAGGLRRWSLAECPGHHQRELLLPERAAVLPVSLHHGNVRVCVA